jgi:ABC-type uncharacterized transport system substrate-binding protein
VAPSFGVELRATDLHDAGEIEHAITAFARSPNSGMILTASAYSLQHRKLIITLVLRHQLPTVHFLRGFVADGGLISYGSDTIDLHRRAASHVERILKGEKPADLPVQALPPQYDQPMSECSVPRLKSAIDLNGEANRARKSQSRAIIAADVRRFGHATKKG